MITRYLEQSIITLYSDPIFNNQNLILTSSLRIPLLIDKLIEYEDSDKEDTLKTLRDSYMSNIINKEQFRIEIFQIVSREIIKRALEDLIPNIKNAVINTDKINECSICLETKALEIKCLRCKGSICIDCNQKWPHNCPLCRNEPKINQLTPGRFIHSIRCLDPRCKFNFCKNNKIILYKLFRHLRYCNLKECRLCQISKVIISIRASRIKII